MDLKTSIKTLVAVIVGYNETQNYSPKPISYYLDLTHGDLIRKLEDLNQNSTKAYPTRRALLDYFLYAIDKIQIFMLTNTNSDKLQERQLINFLTQFILDIKGIVLASHKNTLQVTYPDGKIVSMVGCSRGKYSSKLKGYLTNAGQLIENELLIPLDFKDNKVDGIRNILTKMVTAVGQAEENKQLNEKKNSLEQKNISLVEQLQEKEIYINSLLEELEDKENTINQFEETILSLTEKLESAEEGMAVLSQELESAKEANEILLYQQNHPPTYGATLFPHLFFNPMLRTKIKKEDCKEKPKSRYVFE